MNIVFDTNVLISAFVFGGTSGNVLEFCIENDDLYVSEWIINEITKVLDSKFHFPQKEIETIRSLINAGFNIINPHTPLPVLCRDKDDNNILQLAESIKANFIITGDKDLLILKRYRKTNIVMPSEFLTLFKTE